MKISTKCPTQVIQTLYYTQKIQRGLICYSKLITKGNFFQILECLPCLWVSHLLTSLRKRAYLLIHADWLIVPQGWISSDFQQITGQDDRWQTVWAEITLTTYSHIIKTSLKLSVVVFMPLYCPFEVIWHTSMSTTSTALRYVWALLKTFRNNMCEDQGVLTLVTASGKISQSVIWLCRW